MSWEERIKSLRQRESTSSSNTLAPPVALDTDAFEYASVATALLRYRHEMYLSAAAAAAAGGGAEDAADSSRSFVMVELGAGFGKWGLEAIHMGKRLGVRVRAILVEAEPKHLDYMREAIRLSATPLTQVCF